MDKKVIDNIVWYIPIKKLRDNLRIFLLEISYKLNIIQETSNTLNISKTPEEEEAFKRFNEVKNDLSDSRFEINWENRWLCLYDRTSTTPLDIHQTYNVTWFSRILTELKPKKHIDIASRFNDTILPLSAFIDMDFYDIRPVIPPFNIKGLKCIDGSITNLDIDSNSVESISSFSVIEHIGLERYGDPFDPQGDIKAINELIRVTKPGGNIFISVPVMGKPQIQYNAHRVYTANMIIELFDKCTLKEFSKLNSKNIPIFDMEEIEPDHFSEGLFWFIKK